KEYSLITNYDEFFVRFIISNFSDDKVFLEDILQNMKSLVCCYLLVHLTDNNYYQEVFFKRLKELTPEQILKCGNYDTNLTHEISSMIFLYIKGSEKLDDKKAKEVFRKRYAPIIAVDKRLILNYMKQNWNISLKELWGEDNVKKAISYLEKQNLTEEEKQIFNDFTKRNEKDT
ncbi:MAG: hypothetical protein LBS61_04585, partial [Endomicrobium sp.]|nr:hypothetical protein [Endomicrobium sp.]